MAEITEREITAIHDTHDKVIKIETILGNGDKGLSHEVREHAKKIRIIEITLASLFGSGILGGGIFGVVKLLTG